VTSGITVAGQLVMKEPWPGAVFALGLNAGHEIGQARKADRWTGDNTRDLLLGSAGGLLTAVLLQRFATRPKELRLLGLRPLSPPAALQATYERLARCFDSPSRFDDIRWYTSDNGSLSHGNVVVVTADSVASAGAVTRSLLPVFGRRADAQTLRSLEACPGNRSIGAGSDAGEPAADGGGSGVAVLVDQILRLRRDERTLLRQIASQVVVVVRELGEMRDDEVFR
jgi:hypothetical protein